MSRRRWMLQSGPLLLLGPLTHWPVLAQPDAAAMRLNAALQAFSQGQPIMAAQDGLSIESDALVENGNSVPVRLRAVSPMTPENHVQRMLLLAPRNPQPQVAVFHLGPYSGRAEVATRFRMAESQTLIALAAHSDGRILRTQAEVIVTLAACLEN